MQCTQAPAAALLSPQSTPILSDPILSDPILSDPILSDPILSDPNFFDPIARDPIGVCRLCRGGGAAVEANGRADTLFTQLVSARSSVGRTAGRCTHRMQHATCNIQHTMRNVQHTTHIIQHEACNIQLATYNMQHTTYDMQQHAMCNMHDTACNTHHATYNIYHATYNTQHATGNMHPTQHATCSVATGSVAGSDGLVHVGDSPRCARALGSTRARNHCLRGQLLTSVPSAVPRSTLQCSLVRGERPVPRSPPSVPHRSPVPAVPSVPLYP